VLGLDKDVSNNMDEKLTKLLNITSIPAILMIFYFELQSIEVQISQTKELTKSVIELKDALQTHCHRMLKE
jgi:hypothetical protein